MIESLHRQNTERVQKELREKLLADLQQASAPSEQQVEPAAAPAVAAERRYTGPRTPEGKARSSQNALKHGLCSRNEPVASFENPQEYERFKESLLGSLAPRTLAEKNLAERIAMLSWRAQRVGIFEAQILDHYTRRCDQGTFMSPFFVNGSEQQYLCLARYEATLDRALARALRTFADLQARRPKSENCETN